MIIRTCNENDLEYLSILYEELTGKKTDRNKIYNVFKKINSNENAELFIGEVDGKVIASIYIIICENLVGDTMPFAVFENIIVSSSGRRSGYGQRLLEFAENFVRNKKCDYIIFCSGAQRHPAHALYKKLGYDEYQTIGFKKKLKY